MGRSRIGGSLISFGLFILPVGVTLGILAGLQSWRTATGQPPLFVSIAVRNTTYCQLSYGITPETGGQEYTLNPNQWGVSAGYTGPGGLCMNVTTYDNGTYPTNTSAPAWSITWMFPQGPQDQPVHAFPNIQMVDETVFPSRITDVENIFIDVDWDYGVGDTAPTSTDTSALSSVNLNANVAIDMFLDPSSSTSSNTDKAKYEMMIWLGVFGPATQPIGLDQGAVATQVINGTTFNLYYGVNGLQQNVLSWVAAANVYRFVGDVAPLLKTAVGHGGLGATDYWGYMALGSETLWSSSNITLSVPDLHMSVNTV